MLLPSPTPAAGRRCPHLRLRRAIDVGIENADTGAFLGQRQGQVDRRRALADAALPEATAMMFLTPGISLTPICTEWATILLKTLADTFADARQVRTAAITCLRMASIWVLADSRVRCRRKRRCHRS